MSLKNLYLNLDDHARAMLHDGHGHEKSSYNGGKPLVCILMTMITWFGFTLVTTGFFLAIQIIVHYAMDIPYPGLHPKMMIYTTSWAFMLMFIYFYRSSYKRAYS